MIDNHSQLRSSLLSWARLAVLLCFLAPLLVLSAKRATTSSKFFTRDSGTGLIPTQTIYENSGLQTLSLTAPAGTTGEAPSVTVTAVSDNTALIPDPTVTITNLTLTLTYLPLPNAVGTANITLTATDNTGVLDPVVTSFAISVLPVNQPPALNQPAAQTILENAGVQTIPLTGIGPGGGPNEAGQTVTLTAISGNTALIPTPTVTGSGANRTLTYQPSPSTIGSTQITLVAQDNGGTDNGGIDTTTVTFTVTVLPVNQPPTLDPIADVQIISNNAGLQSITLTNIGPGGGPDEVDQVVNVTASSNSSLIPTPTILGYGATRTLQFTPIAGGYGTALITVTAKDNGGTANGGVDTRQRTFNVTLIQPNQPPTINPLTSQMILEDAGVQTINLTGIGPGVGTNEAWQTVTVTATSANTALIPTPIITGTGANRTLTYQPTPLTVGTALITLTVQDNGGTVNGGVDTTTLNFTITVQPVNHPPTLDPISDISISVNAGLQSMVLTNIGPGGGPNEVDQTVTVTATSNNTSLIPNPAIIGNGVARTLQYTPITGQYGSAVITVTEQDNGGTANGGIDTQVRTFTITVNPPNQPPTIDPISAQTIPEDAGIQTIALTGIGPGGGANEANQTVTVTATSGNTALIPTPTITGTGANRSLTYQPTPLSIGASLITVVVQDNGGTANGGKDTTTLNFTITVQPVNHPPTLDPISDVSINENAGTQTIPLTNIGPGGGPDEASQTVTLTATSSDTNLVPNPTISGSGASRTLQFTPVPNANGSVVITVTAQDNGGTANGGVDTLVRSFTITVASPIAVPTILSPLYGAVVSQQVPFTLSATDPSNRNLLYRIQASTSTYGPWTTLFTSAPITSGTTATFKVNIATPSYTFWRARAESSDGTTGTWSTPSFFTFATVLPPFANVPGTSLFGLSLTNGPTTVADLGLQGTGISLATWDAAHQQYLYNDATHTQITSIIPGQGYWLRTTSPLQIPFSGIASSSPFTAHLQPGWNLISLPFLQDVPWDLNAIQVQYNEQTKTLADAAQANWVKGFAWVWQMNSDSPGGGNYALVSDTSVIPDALGVLSPWQGYWVKAMTACDLIIPPPQTNIAYAPPSRAVAQGWFVRLALRSGSGSSAAQLGEHPLGSTLSVSCPPAAPVSGASTPQLSFTRNGQPLALDVLPVGTGTQNWDLTVSLPPVPGRGDAGPMTLTWPNLTTLPKSMALELVDVTTGTRCYMRTCNQYVFTAQPGETQRKFTIIADNNRQSLLQVQGLYAERTRAHGARISFTMSKAAQVTVCVRTLTGRVLTQLPTTTVRAGGAQSAVWNGCDAQGRTMPRGCYLFQVQATDDEQRQVHAMTTLSLD